MRKKSKKREAESRIYSNRKLAYFERLADSQGLPQGELPWCEAWGKPYKAVHWHHILPLGRGGKLNQDEDLMMAVCEPAHRWIHDNPKEAEAKGWLLSSWQVSL